MSSYEKSRRVENILHSFVECSLPCWLNIIPGETRFDEALILARNIGHFWTLNEYPNPSYEQKLSAYFQLSGRPFVIETIFLANNGVVERIEVNAMNSVLDISTYIWFMKEYSVEKIVKRYGEPSQVLFDAFRDTPAQRLAYYMQVVYDNYGFDIYYIGVTDKAENAHICPSLTFEQVDDIRINIQTYDSPSSLSALREIGLELQPLETLNGMSVVDFYALFSTEGQAACFDIPLAAFQH